MTRSLNLKFEEIVVILDEPEFIISMPSIGEETVIMALYPSKGVKTEFYAKSGDLQLETKIDTFMIFDSLYYENLLDAGMFSMGGYNSVDTKKIMYPWKGYGSITELYPPRFP